MTRLTGVEFNNPDALDRLAVLVGLSSWTFRNRFAAAG